LADIPPFRGGGWRIFKKKNLLKLLPIVTHKPAAVAKIEKLLLAATKWVKALI
jgi:hypothetical protein